MSDEMRAELKMKSLKKLRNNQEQLMLLTKKICRQLGPNNNGSVVSSSLPLTINQSKEIEMIVQCCRRAYQMNVVPFLVQKEECNPTAATTAIIFVTVIRRVFTFLQSIPQLQQLHPASQTSLLKQHGMESLIVLSALTFDPIGRKWTSKDQTLAKEPVPIHVCEKDFERLHGVSVTRKHFDTICSLLSMNADEQIITLLSLVTFFTVDDNVHNDPNEAARILLVQEHFIELLKRYVHWKMGPDISEKAFARFILKLSDVREVNNLHKVRHLKLNDLIVCIFSGRFALDDPLHPSPPPLFTLRKVISTISFSS